MSKADFEFTVSSKILVEALVNLDPTISALISGDHGTGKSQIARQVADQLGIDLIDRRLSQMTEGDLIGLPDKTAMDGTGVTKFIPVDWYVEACEKPVVLLLDEYNRATPELQQGGMQITLDRELNGRKLHPETRVIACINPPGMYDVQEMDPALIDRFAKFNYAPTTKDWLAWANDSGIDPLIVEFIDKYPDHLRCKDVASAAPGTVLPSPRSWERLDKQLRRAGIAPSEIAGTPVTPLFVTYAHALVGTQAANTFAKFVSDAESLIAAEEVINGYNAALGKRIKRLPQESLVALIDRLVKHHNEHGLDEGAIKNIKAFVNNHMTDEDLLNYWQKLHNADAAITPDLLIKLHTAFHERLIDTLEMTEKLRS